jgi:hypothetical protein
MTAETPGTGELRQDIERTRERMGETVERLTAKMDVKSQAKARAAELASATPEPVRRALVKGATTARARRRPLVAATAGLTIAWIALWWWRNR